MSDRLLKGGETIARRKLRGCLPNCKQFHYSTKMLKDRGVVEPLEGTKDLAQITFDLQDPSYICTTERLRYRLYLFPLLRL